MDFKIFNFRLFIISTLCSVNISCRSKAQEPTCIEELNLKIEKIKISDSLNLKNLDCFRWDSLMVIAPEFSRTSVEKYSGTSLPTEIKYEMYPATEQVWWMVFLDKGKYTAHVKVPLRSFSFNDLLGSYYHKWDYFIMPKKDCVFEFNTRKGYTLGKSDTEILLVKLKK